MLKSLYDKSVLQIDINGDWENPSVSTKLLTIKISMLTNENNKE